MHFFTADEHYGHTNIIDYCKRPFESVEEMDAILIERHNSLVTGNDVVIHAGDFCMKSTKYAEAIIKNLRGSHIFLKGSHDWWLKGSGLPTKHIYEKQLEPGVHVVACHYAMRTWGRSHRNSWQLYGHSHGKLQPVGKQWDVGVDNNDFYPVSLDKIKEIMASRPDNPNYHRKGRMGE